MNAISVSQLSNFIGVPNAPYVVDVRIDEDFLLNPNLIPGADRRDFQLVETWMNDYVGQAIVILCQGGFGLARIWTGHPDIVVEA